MVKMVNFIVYLTTINYGRIKKKLKDLKQPFNYAHRFRGEGVRIGGKAQWGGLISAPHGLGLRWKNSKAERRG